MKKYIIQDKEAGNIINEFQTLEEAENKLREYEKTDKAENTYIPNFYEIIETPSVTDNIKDIYLYDEEYIMIIMIHHQRRVDYKLVESKVFNNLKQSKSDLIGILEDNLDIKSYELARVLNDLNNYYIISNNQYDESDYLSSVLTGENRPHKANEIINILNRLSDTKLVEAIKYINN